MEAITVGSIPEIVIFDSERTFGVEKIHVPVGYSFCEGMNDTGNLETVLSLGRVVIENGGHKRRLGVGQLLKSGEYVRM
jgi:dihydroorotase-like cyclic amidohydrolase